MGISGFIFGIASSGAAALGFLATSMIAFLAPPGVVEMRPESTSKSKIDTPRSVITDDTPRLRLVSRTSRHRNSTRAITITPAVAAAPRLARDQQMRRITSVVEDATVRSMALRQLQERTRTQIDAAEQALISLRDELAAIMPAMATPQLRAAA